MWTALGPGADKVAYEQCSTHFTVHERGHFLSNDQDALFVTAKCASLTFNK